MVKCAIYLRVSSREQTVENQLPQLLEFAQSRGYEVGEVYEENESAWRGGHQKELGRFLDNLRSGRHKYDILLVWALDRLTREGIAVILGLVNSLRVYGCKVVSAQESWTETSGPAAELLYSVTAWVAKFESDRRSERVRAGQARARKQGKKLGRPAGA